MLTRQSLLLWWGLTVTVAYLITQYLGNHYEHAHSAVLWTWSVAMVVPLILTVALGRQANALVWVWAAITAAAMAENIWVHSTASKSLMPLSYHTLWFAFGAIGFAYTATAVEGSSRKTVYAVAALLNLAGAVLTIVDKDLLKGYEFYLLAVVQGVPMLLDGPLRSREERAASS